MDVYVYVVYVYVKYIHMLYIHIHMLYMYILYDISGKFLRNKRVHETARDFHSIWNKNLVVVSDQI